MRKLRGVYIAALVVSNVGVLIGIFALIDKTPIYNSRTAGISVVFAFFILVVAILNLIYVVSTLFHAGSTSRIGTLINLWFDAKERELRERGVSPPEPNE